jgi:hypothetical protein
MRRAAEAGAPATKDLTTSEATPASAVTQTLASTVIAGLDPATRAGRAANASGSDLWMLGSSPSVTTE